MNFANKFYYGVVESRADPLKLGRCKVRIQGIHTENTTLLPTKDLPWAIPMQPITSAAVSGIGISPTGPVEGTWVICIFRDEGSYQEPIMLGTLAGIPEEKEVKFTDSYTGTAGTRYEGLSDLSEVDAVIKNSGGDFVKDSQGNPVLDSEGNPVSTGSGSGNNDNVLKQIDGKTKESGTNNNCEIRLGSISSKHESRNNPSIINDYKGKASGDPGGASYGKYQFASFRGPGGKPKGNSAGNSTVDRFVKKYYPDEFKGLTPGTDEFDAKWKEVARKDSTFEEKQDEFAKDEFYSKGVNYLKQHGIDISGRGPAVQEIVFATSIQFNRPWPLKRALEGKNLSSLSDEEIVKIYYEDRKKNVDRDFRSSSTNIRNGIRKRLDREENELKDLANKCDGSTFSKEEIEAIRKKQKLVEEQKKSKGNNSGKEGGEKGGEPTPIPSSGITEPITIPENEKPGFQDPFGIYPRKKWVNEQDVSRLARNEKIDQTIQKSKENSLVKNVGIAGGGSWDEPKSPYNAIYPLNHVYQTESGHTVEYDDTPDAERIHIYHRAGSFIEFHPNGTVVYKSTKDNYEVVVSNKNVFVGGDCNITVNGNTNIYTKGVLRMESDGDMFIKTGSNLRIGAEGQAFIESNGDLHLGSSGNIHEGASNIFMNCSWYPSGVSAGDYSQGKISVEVYDDDEPVPVPPSEE